ncbi:unknown [Clostridium sp. CAG:269]|nr:unknown [Clostridium sp. CAG:269]
MSRYAYNGQEVLERDGKLVGFNAGYGFYAEHESNYAGKELMKPKRIIDKNKNHPFNGEIVEKPDEIQMMEFNDGNVWVTNNLRNYYSLMKKTEEERREIMDIYINNDDRKRTEKFISSFGGRVDSPEVVALWNAGFNGGGNFDLISTNEQSSELLRKLYSEMQKGNVAISSDYSFMFKDRGLSFVLLNQLTQEDLMNKKLVDHRDELGKKFQEEYREYLEVEGLGEFEEKYPLGFWNLQITGLNQTDKGISPEFYLELYHINHGDWDNNSCLFNVTHRMSGDEIKFLVPIAKSKEFEEFANSHSKEDIEAYINEQLEQYHEQQKIAEEQGYQIGEDSLNSIATEQRTGTVEKSSSSLREKIGKWLHPDRKNEKDKSEEKGE